MGRGRRRCVLAQLPRGDVKQRPAWREAASSHADYQYDRDRVCDGKPRSEAPVPAEPPAWASGRGAAARTTPELRGMPLGHRAPPAGTLDPSTNYMMEDTIHEEAIVVPGSTDRCHRSRRR